MSFFPGVVKAEDRDQRRRDRMVSGLLRPDCAQCPAKAGEWCDPGCPPPSQYARIDRDPPHVIHSTRLAAAIERGYASRPLVIAQFDGGQLPDGL